MSNFPMKFSIFTTEKVCILHGFEIHSQHSTNYFGPNAVLEGKIVPLLLFMHKKMQFYGHKIRTELNVY